MRRRTFLTLTPPPRGPATPQRPRAPSGPGSGHNNSSLNRAKSNKGDKDEYYTLEEDAEKELLAHGRAGNFRNKTVLCPCDDPTVSVFPKFFLKYFDEFELKGLVSTCYQSNQHDMFSDHSATNGLRLDFDGSGGKPIITEMAGTGDFQNPETTEILREANIAVTNPPFSKIRKYCQWLKDNDKEFIMVGPNLAMKYDEFREDILAGKINFGQFGTTFSRFRVPKSDPQGVLDPRDGKYYRNPQSCLWYTNVPVNRTYQPLAMTKKFKDGYYPKYKGTNIINVDNRRDIPMDYYGVMGVPFTFWPDLDPSQFKVLDCIPSPPEIVNEKGETELPFSRILIQRI